MKKIFLLLALLGITISSYAQDPSFEWAGLFKSTSLSNPPSINDIDRDSSGNYYVVGTIEQGDTVNFDIKSGITQLSSTNGSDGFLAKYTNDGNLLWVRLFKSSIFIQANAVLVRPNQDVLVGGSYYGTADFDPGASTASQTSTSYDYFIARLTPAGDYVGHSVNPEDGNQYMGKIKQDKKGTAYYSIRSQVGNTVNVIVIKSGVWQYYLNQTTTSTSSLALNDFTIDTAGSLYMVGGYRGQFRYNPADLTKLLYSNSSNYTQPYIIKVDSNGSFLFQQNIACNDLSAGQAVVTDDANNLYFTGYAKSSFPVLFGTGLYFNSTLNYNTFITKYTPAGAAVWVKQIESTASNLATGISLDKKNNIYVHGYYFGTADFNPDTALTQNLVNSPSINSLYILKLTKAGKYSGVADLRGKNNGYFNNLKIFNNEILAVGYFQSDTCDLNLGAAESIFTATLAGQASPFITKHTFANCDATVTQTATGLTANIADAASYEWVECSSQLPLGVPQAQSIVLNGSISVQVNIEKGFCSTKSVCINYVPGGGVGINELNEEKLFTLYPNPASNMVNISVLVKATKLTITDLLGNVVFEQTQPSEQAVISTREFAAGMYFVSIESNGKKATKRLVIHK